jgi:hypothetical protein
MIDAPLFRSGSAFCTVNSTPAGLRIEIVIKALESDIGQLHAIDGADIGDHHVELVATRCTLA